MKKRFLMLVLLLLLLPAARVLAARSDGAELQMKTYYAVLGGEQSITIRSHTEHGGRGGYCQAVYACPLTGAETQAELEAKAVELVKSGKKPVWGGSKHCLHAGAYTMDPSYTMRATAYDPGSYLYVCYTFACEGSGQNHDPVPSYERIAVMSLRVTQRAEGLELQYILKDYAGGRAAALRDGGEAELKLDGGQVELELYSAVEYPVERVVDIRADFPKDQAADSFTLEDRVLSPVCCGSGSVTVTIGNYLDDTTRTETIYIEVPCRPRAERTVLTAPTCTREGVAANLCYGYGINCESTFYEAAVSPVGHTLRSVDVYVLKPTATQPGIGLGRCAVCGLEGAEQKLPSIFTDVVGDSFYSVPLDYCYERGWVSGITPSTFAPESVCVRAQVVTFLWRAAGKPEPTLTENPFADVREGDFYYDAVLWAVENGITTGTDARHFSPGDMCNRAQVVTFLWRAFGQPETAAQEQPFTDVKAGRWYERPVLWAVEEGITSGMSATTFGPTADCNRAQIVTFLYRAYAE